MVKNLPAVQKTWIQSLGQEDPLEKGKYSCLENAMDRGAWWAYSSMDPKGWDMPEPLSLFILLAVSSQGLPSVHAW